MSKRSSSSTVSSSGKRRKPTQSVLPEEYVGQTHIDVDFKMVGDVAELLAASPTLTSLNMSRGVMVLATTLRKLALSTHLKKLDVSFSRITDIGLVALAKSTSLVSLIMHDCSVVTSVGAVAISKSTSITELNADDCKHIGPAGIRALMNSTVLKSLSIGHNRTVSHVVNFLVVDDIERLCAVEDGLTELCVPRCGLNIGQLLRICSSRSLTSLDVQANRVSTRVAKVLGESTTLTSLVLASCNLTDECLSALSVSTCLAVLDIAVNEKITSVGYAAVCSIPTLTSLCIGRRDIDPQSAAAIASCATLLSLAYRNSAISSDFARALSSNTSITSLDFGYSMFTNAAAEAFSVMQSVTSLDLTGVRAIKDQDCIEPFTRMRNLVKLYMPMRFSEHMHDLNVRIVNTTKHEHERRTYQNMVDLQNNQEKLFDAVRSNKTRKLYEAMVDMDKLRFIPVVLLRMFADYAAGD